ncbi:MAG: sigma 54-interacting transcriptional regulator [Desulfomonilaceae bacterium]
MPTTNHSPEFSLDPLVRLPEPLRRLARDKDVLREYRAGDLIIGPDHGSGRICFLVSGEASLVLRDDDKERLAVDSLGAGDIFGEISFFTGIPWPSDAELVADEPCRVLEIPPEDFERMMRGEPDFAVTMVKNLVRKIMQLDRAILKGKLRRRDLQVLISREEHVFPDYIMGDYVRHRLSARVEELALSDGPVLIIGENGVGKEGLAHSIFRASHHCKEVFLQADLLRTSRKNSSEDALPEVSRVEADRTEKQLRLFFGSDEPAGDGGTKEKPGYFELTEEGTLLVRGIEQLTPVMQTKLLEAIVTGTFRRYGGVRLHKVRVRLFATTRLDAAKISLERHPLLYALLQGSIVIPPLRTRRREIPGLVKYYLQKYSQDLGRKIERLPKDTLKTLVNYGWPGNDLELSSTLKRAILVSADGTLRPRDIYFDLKRVEGEGKFNLLRFGPVRQVLSSPLFPAVLQSAATPFFFIVIAFLFLGPADLMKNPAALFSWAVGWPLLIIGAFVWARFWCSLCPIGTVGNLAKRIIALERPFPAFLKNHSDFVMAGAVLFIIWFETATGIRNSPFTLGLLLSIMLASAIIVAVIYERQSWCHYLCGLGGVAGVLAKTSMLELRADRNVCISQCGSNECYLGTTANEGCPFGQAGPRLHSNRLCTLCGTCVKNCPHGAINLNLRVPGSEIWEVRHTNAGTAFLVLGMIGGLFSEMVGKMPFYGSLSIFLPLSPITRFTVVFIAVLLAMNLMLVLAAKVSSRIYRERFRGNYSRFGLALLPVALTAFMAFHVYYLINLGVQLPTLLSHNFDFAVFRRLVITVPPEVTRFIQEMLIYIGLGWSLIIMYRLGRAGRDKILQIVAGLLPHAALALLLAVLMLEATRSFFYR